MLKKLLSEYSPGFLFSALCYLAILVIAINVMLQSWNDERTAGVIYVAAVIAWGTIWAAALIYSRRLAPSQPIGSRVYDPNGRTETPWNFILGSFIILLGVINCKFDPVPGALDIVLGTTLFVHGIHIMFTRHKELENPHRSEAIFYGVVAIGFLASGLLSWTREGRPGQPHDPAAFHEKLKWFIILLGIWAGSYVPHHIKRATRAKSRVYDAAPAYSATGTPSAPKHEGGEGFGD